MQLIGTPTVLRSQEINGVHFYVISIETQYGRSCHVQSYDSKSGMYLNGMSFIDDRKAIQYFEIITKQ